MARWRLTEKHYLNVPDTRWEYTEVDRKTGKPKRTMFPVQLYLDPQGLDDLRTYGQNNPEYPSMDPEDWIIVVRQGDTGNAKDIEFAGDPTPGMLPLDEEAQAITAKCSKNLWQPTKDLSPEAQNASYTAQLLGGLIEKVSAASTQGQGGAQIHGMSEFMESMGAMMKQQTEILAALAQAQVASKSAGPRMSVRG